MFLIKFRYNQKQLLCRYLIVVGCGEGLAYYGDCGMCVVLGYCGWWGPRGVVLFVWCRAVRVVS